jgi:hypothetical protein
MKAIKKLEIIKALGETTSALKIKKAELIEDLFKIKYAAEKQILELSDKNFIDLSDYGISYLNDDYDYMMFDGKLIERLSGNCGDFNNYVPQTDFKKLVEFCEKSTEIIKGMQEEVDNRLKEISDNIHK